MASPETADTPAHASLALRRATPSVAYTSATPCRKKDDTYRIACAPSHVTWRSHRQQNPRSQCLPGLSIGAVTSAIPRETQKPEPYRTASSPPDGCRRVRYLAEKSSWERPVE